MRSLMRADKANNLIGQLLMVLQSMTLRFLEKRSRMPKKRMGLFPLESVTERAWLTSGEMTQRRRPDEFLSGGGRALTGFQHGRML
jgi:hypothetical protein